MQNKLSDLNNHLFAQLERLGDEELAGDQLTAEINRARAVSDIATQVIASGNLVLKAETFKQEYGIGIKNDGERKMPPALRNLFLEE